MKQFKSVFPIGDGDVNAVPVKNVSSAMHFYTQTLGFGLMSEDEKSAVLRRDDVQIGLVAKADHDPATAGSFYFDVENVDDLRREFEDQGAKPGAIKIQEHEGKKYRLFFLRECDMLETHDGYCFCFGKQVPKEG